MNNWLNQFKIAVINQNHTAIIELHDKMPEDLDIAELKQVKVLIDSAVEILEAEKQKIGKKLDAFRKVKDYGYSKQSTTFDFTL